jgi:pimeloyl-ACP methyl ester carboxylesterase
MGDVERSETRYARSGDLSIAYQVVGDGPFDLVYVPGWVSNIELMWEEPGLARFLERLASFSRLILFDKRGTGLSDPVPTDGLPTLEERMDDVRAVMDAVGSERAALLGHSEGGNMCVLFTATYPSAPRRSSSSAVTPSGSARRTTLGADRRAAFARDRGDRGNLGIAGGVRGARAQQGEGSGLPAMDRAVPAAVGQPEGRRRPHAHEHPRSMSATSFRRSGFRRS